MKNSILLITNNLLPVINKEKNTWIYKEYNNNLSCKIYYAQHKMCEYEIFHL